MEREEVEAYSNSEFTSDKNQSNKLLAGHVVLFLILSVLLGYLSYLNINSLINPWLPRIQVIAFLGLGALHLYLYDRKLAPNLFVINKSLYFTLLLSASTLLVLFLLDLFKGRDNFFLSLASSSAFILPSLIFNSWLLFQNFPVKQNKVWFDFENIKDNRATVYLNSIPLVIKLTKKYFDIEEEDYHVTLPGHITFGKLFNKFLSNLSEDGHIEIVDETKQLYGWVFYEQRLAGYNKKYLDPDLTLRENKVKNNSVIIAKRVKRNFNTQSEKLYAIVS